MLAGTEVKSESQQLEKYEDTFSPITFIPASQLMSKCQLFKLENQRISEVTGPRGIPVKQASRNLYQPNLLRHMIEKEGSLF